MKHLSAVHVRGLQEKNDGTKQGWDDRGEGGEKGKKKRGGRGKMEKAKRKRNKEERDEEREEREREIDSGKDQDLSWDLLAISHNESRF